LAHFHRVSPALADRNPSLQIELRPGQDREYLVRVRSTSSIQVPIAVATASALLERAHEAQLALGVYYGIMLGLFFYNLVLYLSLRDRTFLYYIAYVLVFALGQFTLNGLAFEYFWPHSPEWANTAVLVLIGLGLVAMLAFTRAFLEFARQLPRIDRAVRFMIAGLALIVLANPLLGYRNTIFVETGMVFVMVVTIFTAAIALYRRGYRPARNYLIAWTALLLGVVAFAAVSFGLLPKVFLTEFGIQIGSAAEMILLSFALADRVHMLREENALLQRETAERLELRVQERTQALHAALDQLQQANRVLNDFSLRDGLTGTYNRRYLNRALEDLLARTRREGVPFSVLMVDLDRFKHVNDKHGHLSGDDCLIALAQCLMGLLHGESERVARFGGEEFAVLLPGVALPAARARAELIRAEIERLEVRSDDQRLSITASIGVAGSAGSPSESGADILRNADRALYEAKRRGRNRVVVVDPRASGFEGREQTPVGN
jgi:diguanylate cyclase (GGDEF)-like protein